MTFRCTHFAIVALALCLSAGPGFAEGPAGGTTIADAAGHFTLPVPGGWEAEAQGPGVILTSPDKGIELRVAAFERAEPETLVAAMWGLADPSLALPLPEAVATPSRDGVEETWLYDYRMTDGTVVQAVVELGGPTGYVTLLRGNLDELGRRQAQLAVITTGLAVEGAEAVDLSEARPDLDQADLNALRDFIRTGMERMDVPGAAVAVVQNGEVILLEGFGLREQGGADPIAPDTRMMIGSTGKTMTSMLVAQLVDEGLMGWDDPVRAVLPEFAMADPAVSDAMSIRHLLCACTGVPRRDLEVIFNASELSAEEVIGSLSTFEVFTGFGETFQYSNQLVGTAGWAAAAAAGAEWGDLEQGYSAALESRIFGPIGMPDTTLSVAEVLASGNYALPHELSADGTRVLSDLGVEAVLAPIAPAGTHWSTAEDMSRYLLTLLNGGATPDGTRIASVENLSQAWQPQVAVTAESSYGLGWFLDDFHGQQLIHHGGNTMGFTSDLAFLPEAGLGIVVLTNGRATNAFNEGVRGRLFELAFDLPERAGEAAELMHDNFVREVGRIAEAGPVRQEDVADHLGEFSNPSLGTVTLSLEGDALRLDAGEFAMTVRSAEGIESFPRDYVVTDGLLITTALDLTRNGNGEPVIVLGTGVEEYEFTREP